ncbi:MULTISPECIES: hypothetical protein [unclassified Pseudodesulfovibrio]|uniref:hypothetical protein n=1 Tax=unclassified Pseudodesulfovibrio TaxID=2661612 RepID=UPI000FEBFA95|nr:MULTISPECIES: hypothetical protein [unclassified Pseudodesulfovibrio]MCJ2163540.1 hypothetical protein [Pseudodesulfovibrio sp. S3-i]
MAKKKIDPSKIFADYVIDMRGDTRWFAELHYTSTMRGPRGNKHIEMSNIPTLNISGKLSYTESKKVELGSPIDIRIYTEEEERVTEFIGIIDKYKNVLQVVLWLPWEIANHLHMTLISGKAEMVTISGTDLYRRSASVRGIDMKAEYDLQDYFE